MIMNKFKIRYDSVIRDIINMIKAIPGHRSTIYWDCSIKLINNDELPFEMRNLIPDIWFEQNDEYLIIEVTIPYGDTNDQDSRICLELRANEKTNKYMDLINKIIEIYG